MLKCPYKLEKKIINLKKYRKKLIFVIAGYYKNTINRKAETIEDIWFAPVDSTVNLRSGK